MRAVNLLIESKLPPRMRNYNRTYTAREVGAILSDLAVEAPELYKDVAKSIADVGRKASYWQGETLGLSDIRPLFDKKPVLDAMAEELKQLPRDAPDFEQQREGVWQRYNAELQRMTNEAGQASNSALAASVLSGARGKDAQLKMMVTTPGIYADAQGRTVPLFIRHGFNEGIRPAEFLASTYGARSSVVSTKVATAKGGDLQKQMVMAALKENIREEDCGTDNGIDLDLDDSSISGRVLAREVDGIPAGTVIDRAVLKKLNKDGIKKVVARSPMTCSLPEGMCSKCLGKFYDRQFSPIGASVGATAGQAVGEPICLDEDTLVLMADWSVKKIKDVQVGDMVLGADMHGVLTPTRVLNVFHNGPRDCVKSVFRKGRGAKSDTVEMVSTTAHKILCSKTKRGWDKKIQPVEWNGLPHMSAYFSKGLNSSEFDKGVHEPWAALLGLFLGAGSYAGTNRGVGLSCYDPETVEWAASELNRFGLELKSVERGEWRVRMLDTSGVRNKTKHPMKLKLMKEGMWGGVSYTKILPKNIRTWSNRSVADFIGGYLATDDWVLKNGVIGFSSTSEGIVQGVKELLETRFGIYCTRVTPKRKKRKGGGHYRNSYTVNVTGLPSIEHFKECVSIPGIKQARLVSAVQARKLTDKERGRFKILAQTPVGVKDTWDLEVDNDTHLFALANGLIVSNTQGALGAKHTSGIAGQKRTFSGFPVISQLVQVPEDFPDRAAVSEVEGRVTRIEEAPQGGKHVWVGDIQHYVPQGFDLFVKEGQQVEPGDALSDGIVSPADVVRLRGLGSGRRFFADRFQQALEDSGFKGDKRNVEILARAMVNHIELEDDEGMPGRLPGDMLAYNQFSREYTPPVSTQRLPPSGAVGLYLQKPTMHYSIGTRITPRQAKRMEESGYEDIYVAPEAPAFKAEMHRLRTSAKNTDDWMARMYGSYIKDTMQESATRGYDTNIKSNPHFAPRLAIGTDFAKNVRTTGEL